ncbi:hypothetical protein IAQ61_007542 [Plenodomus lingam]|uniref:Uncharacterized protein n=1 Tax=Leptosphaeria maculans (strain JN3 / isolate v23.1.3 / race Av1-4-5-6-7-8) TaxID=985895 RepID=E5A5E2_LEPMJ|nr:hypothetical protein LEMA_P080790.1 [Plenodomus lingam JN3]KAH9866952.1 hypothetical protein IAQ61_007542 [Plenodomus lingam]CBX98840.1 hypothetical protein LEMA_P080790.1 [Plenodomus lingam JN3]
MDYSAQLSAAEIQCLGNPDSTFDNATRDLESTGSPNEWAFQRCLRIKNTLDAWEHRVRADPSWGLLALLLHGEYQFWREYAPLGDVRWNPFLSHWVNYIQCLDTESANKALSVAGSYDAATREPSAEVIVAVRGEWIKKMLSSGLESDIHAMTPRTLHHLASLSVKKPFAIQPYLQILLDDGIYSTSDLPVSSTPDSTPPTSPPGLTNGHPGQDTPGANADWKDGIRERLARQPCTAVHELSRLPLQLPHLDFLTKLLAEHTLESHSIDPEPVVLSYIQHSLRTIERMGSAPPLAGQDLHPRQDSSTTSTTTTTTTTPPANDPTNANTNPPHNNDEDEEPIWEYGKEAQARHVRLLLLFIKSLIRKRLLGMDTLYFEIQEICYRYVWIGEVREFRRWVGEGDDVGL